MARTAHMRQARSLGTHTYDEWLALMAANDFRCAACEVRHYPDELTKDHIKPISRGGSDSITNIQPLCRSCNTDKGTMEINFMAETA